jgi:hypothetical protein
MGFFPINQLISFVFKSACFLFLAMCSFQFNLQSKCSPSVFCYFCLRYDIWLMLTVGQWPFRRGNVMCDDLDSLTLIFHFFSHFSIMCKRSWRLSEAIIGCSRVANIVMSSANVPNVVSLEHSCTVHSKSFIMSWDMCVKTVYGEVQFYAEKYNFVRRSTILLLGFSEIKFNGFLCVWNYKKIFTHIDN